MKKVYVVLETWVDDPYLAPYESIVCVVKNEEMAKKICEDKYKKANDCADYDDDYYMYGGYTYKEFEVKEEE